MTETVAVYRVYAVDNLEQRTVAFFPNIYAALDFAKTLKRDNPAGNYRIDGAYFFTEVFK